MRRSASKSSAARSKEPLRQIANAGFARSAEVNRVKQAKSGQDFDAMSGELGDMIKAGIVEPFKVTRSALQDAASIGALVLTTGPDRRTPEPKQPARRWAAAAWATTG